MAFTAALMAPTMPQLKGIPSIGNLRANLANDAATNTTTTTTTTITTSSPEASIVLAWSGPAAYWAVIAQAAADRAEADEGQGEARQHDEREKREELASKAARMLRSVQRRLRARLSGRRDS